MRARKKGGETSHKIIPLFFLCSLRPPQRRTPDLLAQITASTPQFTDTRVPLLPPPLSLRSYRRSHARLTQVAVLLTELAWADPNHLPSLPPSLPLFRRPLPLRCIHLTLPLLLSCLGVSLFISRNARSIEVFESCLIPARASLMFPWPLLSDGRQRDGPVKLTVIFGG